MRNQKDTNHLQDLVPNFDFLSCFGYVDFSSLKGIYHGVCVFRTKRAHGEVGNPLPSPEPPPGLERGELGRSKPRTPPRFHVDRRSMLVKREGNPLLIGFNGSQQETAFVCLRGGVGQYLERNPNSCSIVANMLMFPLLLVSWNEGCLGMGRLPL